MILVLGYFHEKDETVGQLCTFGDSCQIKFGSTNASNDAYSEGAGMQADCDVPIL